MSLAGVLVLAALGWVASKLTKDKPKRKKKS